MMIVGGVKRAGEWKESLRGVPQELGPVRNNSY